MSGGADVTPLPGAKERLQLDAQAAREAAVRGWARDEEARADFGAILWGVGSGVLTGMLVGTGWRGAGAWAAALVAAYGLRTWIVARVRAEALHDNLRGAR